MTAFWVIVLVNFFNVVQAELPEHYPNHNTCNIALVRQGYTRIDPLGVHGRCEIRVVDPTNK